MKHSFRRLVPSCLALLCLLPACGSSGDDDDSNAVDDDNGIDGDLPVSVAEGLAPTPPMGWNSWNRFACNVSATLIKQTADAMVESGMRDAGYQYINIDDCWAQAARAEDGTVLVSSNFPKGISEIADYVHGLGLKLGIYSDRGTATCGGRVGSQGYEELDAATYAAWGVDYLKYDNCNATLDAKTQYETMRAALDATGRPMVFSICAWNFYEWAIGTGHLWRTTTDIRDSWDSVGGMGSVVSNIMNNRQFAPYSGPNAWNDPDMLEVGNGALSDTEYRAHFALWAISAAPLIAGNDLRGLEESTKAILTNPEVIAVDQDALGIQGVPVWTQGELSVWAKPLNESGARAVLLFNASGAAADVSVNFKDVGLRAGKATVRDLWDRADRGEFTDSFTANVPSHGGVMLKINGTEPRKPKGNVFLSDIDWVYAANALGPVEKDTSVGATAAGDGEPMSIEGQTYEKGLGVAGASLLIYRLGKACTTFRADIGVDDVAEERGSVVFQVWGDDELLFESDVMTGTTAAQTVEANVEGKSRLRLLVTSGGDGPAWDRADWANARVECAP